MLSILIPVYNYNIVSFINEIHKQVTSCAITFEILVFEDGSTHFLEENKSISKLSFAEYQKSQKNIGRSAIRNLLASKANYDTLLFIDAGTYPSDTNFIKNYVSHIQDTVVTGGMTFKREKPKKPYILRWVYTKKREAISAQKKTNHPVVCSSNFMIKKKLFDTIKFDESLKKYGCEDVIFFDSILQKQISLKHINNPVVHDANDDANTFIKKTEHAIENLIELIDTNKIAYNRYMVSSIYHKINIIQADKIISLLFRLSRRYLKRNFNSNYPSINCYDFYRLGYFCLLKSKK